VVDLPGRNIGSVRGVAPLPLRQGPDGPTAAIAGTVRPRPGFAEPRPRMMAEPNDPIDLSVLFQDDV
jgi:hypothetical protein